MVSLEKNLNENPKRFWKTGRKKSMKKKCTKIYQIYLRTGGSSSHLQSFCKKIGLSMVERLKEHNKECGIDCIYDHCE
jgi:hypothetical protein